MIYARGRSGDGGAGRGRGRGGGFRPGPGGFCLCPACGEPVAPPRYLEYVTGRSDAVMGKQVLRRLCSRGARQQRAQKFVKL